MVVWPEAKKPAGFVSRCRRLQEELSVKVGDWCFIKHSQPGENCGLILLALMWKRD